MIKPEDVVPWPAGGGGCRDSVKHADFADVTAPGANTLQIKAWADEVTQKLKGAAS